MWLIGSHGSSSVYSVCCPYGPHSAFVLVFMLRRVYLVFVTLFGASSRTRLALCCSSTYLEVRVMPNYRSGISLKLAKRYQGRFDVSSIKDIVRSKLD